jgi:hypothetical protein
MIMQYTTAMTPRLLLLVLIAGSLALMLATRWVNQWTTMRHLNAAVHQLSTDIEHLDSLASIEKTNLFVTVKTGVNWCVGFDDVAPACNCSKPGDCQVKGLNAVIHASPLNDTQLFAKDHRAWKKEGVFYSTLSDLERAEKLSLSLSLKHSSIDLQVHPDGTVYLCSDTVKGYPAC